MLFSLSLEQKGVGRGSARPLVFAQDHRQELRRET
jgi:hypothetical protein